MRKLVGIGAMALVGVIVALMVISGGYFTIQPGYIGLVTSAGSLGEKTYGEGFHLKVPFVDTAHAISVRQQTWNFNNLDAASSDLQSVRASVAVNFNVNPTDKAVQEVFRNYRTTDEVANALVSPAVGEVFKSVTARYTADKLIAQRATVNEAFSTALRQRLQPFNLTVNQVSIVNFGFSKAFDAAIEAKVTAEQNAAKARNDLERIKVEGEQRVTQARAEAEAIRVQAEAVTKQGGAEYVQLKAIEKWDGKLPVTQAGGAVPFVNLGK